MAKKKVAINSMTLSISDKSDSSIIGTITKTGTASSSFKINSTGVCKDNFGVMVSGVTAPGAGATIPSAAPANGQISASTSVLKENNTAVLRENDKTSTLTATPQIPGTPVVNYPVTFKIEITSAGQSDMESE